jgi:hypothetical protein
MKYRYWRGIGDKKPMEIPKGCESKSTFGRWSQCREHPSRWGRMQSETDLCDREYRWPEGY